MIYITLGLYVTGRKGRRQKREKKEEKEERRGAEEDNIWKWEEWVVNKFVSKP